MICRMRFVDLREAYAGRYNADDGVCRDIIVPSRDGYVAATRPLRGFGFCDRDASASSQFVDP
jgi:hypothetical protein